MSWHHPGVIVGLVGLVAGASGITGAPAWTVSAQEGGLSLSRLYATKKDVCLQPLSRYRQSGPPQVSSYPANTPWACLYFTVAGVIRPPQIEFDTTLYHGNSVYRSYRTVFTVSRAQGDGHGRVDLRPRPGDRTFLGGQYHATMHIQGTAPSLDKTASFTIVPVCGRGLSGEPSPLVVSRLAAAREASAQAGGARSSLGPAPGSKDADIFDPYRFDPWSFTDESFKRGQRPRNSWNQQGDWGPAGQALRQDGFRVKWHVRWTLKGSNPLIADFANAKNAGVVVIDTHSRSQLPFAMGLEAFGTPGARNAAEAEYRRSIDKKHPWPQHGWARGDFFRSDHPEKGFWALGLTVQGIKHAWSGGHGNSFVYVAGCGSIKLWSAFTGAGVVIGYQQRVAASQVHADFEDFWNAARQTPGNVRLPSVATAALTACKARRGCEGMRKAP